MHPTPLPCEAFVYILAHSSDAAHQRSHRETEFRDGFHPPAAYCRWQLQDWRFVNENKLFARQLIYEARTIQSLVTNFDVEVICPSTTISIRTFRQMNSCARARAATIWIRGSGADLRKTIMQAIKAFRIQPRSPGSSPRPLDRGVVFEPDGSLVGTTTLSWFRKVSSSFLPCNPILNDGTHVDHETAYVMANEKNGALWLG